MAEELLSVSVEPAHFVRADGEIDMTTASQLEDALALPTSIRLDMTNVRFMDSSGLHVLVNAYQQSQANGTEFVVCRASGMPRQVIEVSGVDFVLCDHRSG